jgi:hypothetical protein
MSLRCFEQHRPSIDIIYFCSVVLSSFYCPQFTCVSAAKEEKHLAHLRHTPVTMMSTTTFNHTMPAPSNLKSAFPLTISFAGRKSLVSSTYKSPGLSLPNTASKPLSSKADFLVQIHYRREKSAVSYKNMTITERQIVEQSAMKVAVRATAA